jgi:hypothetical protein
MSTRFIKFHRKKIKNLTGILFVSLLFILAGCGKNNKIAWVYYDETICADKWERTINNEKLKDNIVAYFKNKGVKIYELEVFSDRTPDQCSDCVCKTGRRIKAKVKNKDVSDMKAENFYE